MIKRIQILTGKPLMTALLAMVVGGLIAMISSCSGGGDQTGAGNPPGGGGIDTNAIDAQAAAMAVDILTGGTQTEPAIQKALLASGFAIQAPDGSLTQPTQSPSQGMLFDQWEVYVMSVAENNSGFITLSDLASAIQANFPDLAKDKLTAFILDGISKSAQSDQPTVRLWARLIVELGRQSKIPYDLLDPNVDPTQVDLSPVQLNLIGERLIGDLMSIGNQNSPAKALAVGVSPSPLPLGVHTALPLQNSGGPPPCTLTETQGKITDGAATGSTKGFEQLWEYLEEKELEGAKTLGELSGAANNIGIFLKLAWTIAAFDGGFLWNGLEDPVGPLNRTPAAAAGEQAPITLGVELKIKDAQIFNCLRLAGNAVGLDFSLWNDGPIKNAGVEWYITKGLTSGGATAPASLGYLEWASGNNPTLGRFTNEEGQDTITIEGAPRSRTITNPQEVDKPGQVIAKVSLKSADIVQDLIDAAASAGSIQGLLNVPVEMLYRTGWTFARELNFTVIDWEDCDTAGSAAGARVKAAGACSDTWTGTSSFTLGSTTSAQVTWVVSEIDGDIVHYQPTGTANFTVPNCVADNPSQSIKPEEGELTIDYSTDPPTYQVFGATVWDSTYTCTSGIPPVGAGGVWVGNSNYSNATGTVTIDPDTHNMTINGSDSGNGISSTWTFTKD